VLRLFGAQVERPVNPGAWATGGLTALLVLQAFPQASELAAGTG